MTPHYITPVADKSLDDYDAKVWAVAMRAYNEDRSRGKPRSEAVQALRPLLEHPRLATAAQIMIDLASRYPE